MESGVDSVEGQVLVSPPRSHPFQEILETSTGPPNSTRAYLHMDFLSCTLQFTAVLSNLTVSSSLTILKTPKLVSSRTVLDQATPSLLILTATAGRGEVVDSNVTWKSNRKQLIIKTAVKYILHLFQQCEISEKELNIVDPVGAGPGKENSSE